MTFDSIITKEIYETPNCFQQHTDMPYRYVDVYSGSNVIARLALGITGNRCILHGVARKSSLSALKAFRTAYFSTVVPGLKEMNITTIVAYNFTEDDKWAKLMKLLDFRDPVTLQYTEMEI